MIHYPSMRNHMKALAVLAGIKENLCYHVGRHSFASLVTLEAGVPIETISKMLGHGNIQTTQVYARVTPKNFRGYGQAYRGYQRFQTCFITTKQRIS